MMESLPEKIKGMDVQKILQIKEKLRSIIFGQKDLVGVDLGSYAIKVVWLALEGNGCVLKLWGHIPLNLKPEASAEEKKLQAVSLLKEFLSQKAVPLKQAATSVSGNAVIVRYVKLPKLSKQELAMSLPTEAEPYIPFDIREVGLGSHILGEVMEEGQKKMETVLVAVKKDALQNKIDVVEGVGLRPIVIDVDAFALEGVHEKVTPSMESGGAVLYLNIGHTVTNLSIVEGGITRVVRDIFISGSTLTKAIQKALQYDFDKAEEVKRTFGILITPEEKEKALQEGNRDALGVSQAVSAVVHDLVVEMHRSVDFYLSQGSERSISKIILAGGSANLKNLPQFLSAELKVPVEVFNPFSFVSEQAPGVESVPGDLVPALAVAMGLALRRMGDWE
ncbi:MAG: type IV pilus assembly protein PilM [Elusimicrobia bacterium]|nr:type IV pilus assembly protein PilM [Elusimicrobiota bacterium]